MKVVNYKIRYTVSGAARLFSHRAHGFVAAHHSTAHHRYHRTRGEASYKLQLRLFLAHIKHN